MTLIRHDFKMCESCILPIAGIPGVIHIIQSFSYYHAIVQESTFSQVSVIF